jgi:Transposase
VRVLDTFHVRRLGLAAVDDVRRRVQQQTFGHRGRREDPLYGIRRVLRRGAEHLTDTAWARLLAGIEAGDDNGQVAAAWVAAQELRAIYRCGDRHQAAARLYDWTVTCIDSGVPELRRLARTITTWRTEFLAYFSTGRISNGPTEAVNLLIKKILRVGHGFRNFRQLPAAPAAALRNHLATSQPDTTTRPTTTLGRVEPDKHKSAHRFPVRAATNRRRGVRGLHQGAQAIGDGDTVRPRIRRFRARPPAAAESDLVRTQADPPRRNESTF